MRTPEELIVELRKINKEVAHWEDVTTNGRVAAAFHQIHAHVGNALTELETVEDEASFEIHCMVWD